MRSFICFVLFMFLSVGVGKAAIPDRDKYDKYFEVNLDDEFPPYEEMEKMLVDKYKVYDRKYKYYWDIGNLFDSVFRLTITEYGSTEKRLKADNEEALMLMLSQIPPEYYQYIGPYLHTVPSISEKILNMPGIKETKNKFPTRIAPQVADMEDLEFLSPYLYFLLMPEVWEGNDLPMEKPLPKKESIKSVRNTQLYDKLRKLLPPDDFYPDAPSKPKVSLSDLRTINITATSPLTSGDIKAFLKTLPALNELQSNVVAMARIYGAGTLIDMWENEQGRGLPINSIKDLIYPCRRLLQKMRVAGEERYLKRIVAKEGFSPEEWAYTCDKTITAYRMSNISGAMSYNLKAFSLGFYNQYIEDKLGKNSEMLYQTIQGALRMYEVPRGDLLEAYKNRELLDESFHNAGYSIIAAPIVTSN